ncbi:DUF4232 domain-containing protein [Streptomyces sp. NPDC015131]|uniref:DUF4232 domain-containing protein n=1 Tax=Streptomyces sp. NPDC015131 TaxID=3364941 RepID=UPI0036F63A58
MRTFRTRTTAAAATALLATLSLTACQNSDIAGPGRSPAPASGAATATTTPATPAAPSAGTPAGNSAAPGQGSGTTTGTSPHSKAPSSTGDDDPAADRPCGEDVKVTYAPVSRPLNHALLTLTNTGSTPCDAYYAPLLRFDDAQAATAVDEGSRPQAVVTVAPGESAYAGLMLMSADGSGSEGGTVKTLSVYFAPRDGQGSTDAPPATVDLPADTYTDSSARVTYWQTSVEDALER